jgi:tetratricopeptide (TPR) repeat protein
MCMLCLEMTVCSASPRTVCLARGRGMHRGKQRAAVSWCYTVIQLFGHGAGVQAWPRLPADDGGVRQLAERRDNANREYQLARAAYERGDFVTAEPLFRKALEFAPEFPEPHFALAQLMQRLGRNEEAQHFMAQVNQRIPQAAEAAQAEAAVQRPLLEHALETARTLRTIRPDAPFVGRALLASARAMDEGRQLVGQMGRSALPQDQHNSRIHAAHQLEAELKLREVLANPLEANSWWQLALLSFNSRREFESASHALEAAMRL